MKEVSPQNAFIFSGNLELLSKKIKLQNNLSMFGIFYYDFTFIGTLGIRAL